MNKETNSIEQGNRLIAEFMGAKKSKVDGDTRYLRFTEPHAGTESYAFFPWKLKYHSSWDWLMPVVEKITAMNIASNSKGMIHMAQIFSALTRVKISEVWQPAVDFIEWYNKEQNVQVSDTTGGDQGTKS